MTDYARASLPALTDVAGVGKARRRWLCAPVCWAVFGVVVIGFQAWVFVRWMAAGDAHAFPSGGYQMSTGIEGPRVFRTAD